MDFKDYYEIIGVSKTAGQEEIQKAYRKLAKEYHPDKNKDFGSEARFKEIGEAYDVLKEPEKRAKYDRYGAAWKAGGNGQGQGFDGVRFDFGGGGQSENFYDVLEHMFGGRSSPGGFGPFHHGPRQSRGEDVEARLPLSLEEASAGGKQTLSLSDPRTGKQKSYTVNIPPGITTGKRIRLSGEGRPGTGGARAGDLFLVVVLQKHAKFELKGNNLYTTIEVLPHQAVLGDKVTLDTFNGQVRINIPAGSSSGKNIRLGGYGLGKLGDLTVELRIVVPGSLSPRERELYEALAAESCPSLE